MRRDSQVPKVPKAPGVRVAIVVSQFHDDITGELLSGAMARLREAGILAGDVEVLPVPGAFEIPLAAQKVAETRRVSAVICLGCVIRGETPHFEYISSACAHGIMAASSKTGVPMAFGVLTTNTVDEAMARAAPGPANKGREAAGAALEMAGLLRQVKGRRP